MAARVLSKFRPETPIIAVMENEQALRKLSFNWGVRGIVIPKLVSTDDIFSMIGDKLMQHHLAEQEDLVVITAGVPTLRRGTTNTMKVHRVGANHERRRSP
jgi:pyruvate kinase